jgi:type 1 glutamine amidotransferase
MRRRLAGLLLLFAAGGAAADRLPAAIIDGVNNHDWAPATAAIKTILEGTGRFTVDVCTWPKLPEFSRYRVVIDNFNGGHTATGTRWPAEAERELEAYVSGGGGLVVYHAANNAFLNWPEFNRMIGLGWRDPTFGPALAIAPDGRVVTIPKGQGLPPGHGPRHDFEVAVLNADHPITRGLPARWMHPSEQLTHGQHGPAEGLTVLTYALSEVSRQGEPMDWVRDYGKGRVYTTMLGHTWKNELSPNLDDVNFQALLARGAEWAATGKVSLPADLGWKALFNGKNLDGWEVRGTGSWSVMAAEGALIGRARASKGQSWLYTKREYGEFDLHVEYWIPPDGNSGVSIRDRSRAHGAIGESDAERPDLAAFPKTSPAHIGYEIQIIDEEQTPFPTGSVYSFVPGKIGLKRPGEWNSLEIESRNDMIRVRVNGQVAAEHPGDPARSKTGPIGLQLHDQFTTVLFRNIRIRER